MVLGKGPAKAGPVVWGYGAPVREPREKDVEETSQSSSLVGM